jgi:hypothetical protein
MLIQNLCQRLPLLVVVIVCASLSPTLGAQEKAGKKSQNASEEATKSPFITKVIHVKHVDVDKIAPLLTDFGSIRASSELGVLVVSSMPEMIASLEDAVRALDVPRPESESSRDNVELMVYIIGAADQELPDAAIPQSLKEVVTQLRQAFPYRYYHLLDTATLRVRPGFGAKTSGLISDSSFEATVPPQYSFEVNAGAVSQGDAIRTIQLDGIRFHFNLFTDTGLPTHQAINVESSIDLHEGKTAVVGKAGIYGVYRGLFLVVSGTVSE